MSLPNHEQLMPRLLEYDVVGFRLTPTPAILCAT